ncbi:MAG: GNAT family N-acetyltransferase [Oscillospiraceae bacterium]|nr:GNAT family N-acetyltransferase [Oscillospiraceae bacterium]
MKILKCTEEYLSAVVELYNKVTIYLENTINYPKWTYGEYPSKESVMKAMQDGVQYVCMDGNKAVGAFVLNDNPQGDYSAGDWSIYLDEGEYLVIHTLASDSDLQGRGIGRMMVEYCIEKAKKDGYKAVRIDVVPGNALARRLYEKCGFSFAGERDLGRGIEAIPEFALYELNL